MKDITVEDIKKSLRIEVTDDDDLIQFYIDSAKEYVQGAIGTTDDLTEFNQYWFAISLLTQFWYQNRDNDIKETPYQIVATLQQLRGKVS